MQVPLPLPMSIWCIWCLLTLGLCVTHSVCGLSGAFSASGVLALVCNASLRCSRRVDSVELLQPQVALPTIALQAWLRLQLSA